MRKKTLKQEAKQAEKYILEKNADFYNNFIAENYHKQEKKRVSCVNLFAKCKVGMAISVCSITAIILTLVLCLVFLLPTVTPPDIPIDPIDPGVVTSPEDKTHYLQENEVNIDSSINELNSALVEFGLIFGDNFDIKVKRTYDSISEDTLFYTIALQDDFKNLEVNAYINVKYIHNRTIEEDATSRLPPTGRLSYDSENMKPLRPQIKRVVDLLIKSNPKVYKAFIDMCDIVVRNDNKTREMLVSQKIDEKYWDSYMTAGKVLDDIYRRLGNYVLNTACIFLSKEHIAKNRYIRKRIKKKTTAGILTHTLSLSSAMENEAMNAFAEYMRRLKQAENETATVENQEGENEME